MGMTRENFISNISNQNKNLRPKKKNVIKQDNVMPIKN